MANNSDDDFLSLYYLFKKYLKSQTSTQEFNRKNNSNGTLIQAAKRSFLFLHKPDYFDHKIKVAKEYYEKNMTKQELAKNFNMRQSSISEVIFACNCYIRIRDIHYDRNIPFEEKVYDMNFISVNKYKKKNMTAKSLTPAQQQPLVVSATEEILPKKNEIEILIQKGIKVCISENIGTETLVKIIEFLKDL